MKTSLKFVFLFVMLNYIYTQNPFSILGIPSLKPSAIFNEDDDLSTTTNNKEKIIRHKQNIPDIKTTEDLQKYLKGNNFDEFEGLNIVSRFLISDDFYSKQNGVVFDVTGFDGLPINEKINPLNTLEREAQRARSAAKIHVIRYFKLFLFYFKLFFYFLYYRSLLTTNK